MSFRTASPIGERQMLPARKPGVSVDLRPSINALPKQTTRTFNSCAESVMVDQIGGEPVDLER